MDDLITGVQGVPERHCQVFDRTVRALEWIFPSFLGESKYPMTVKKLKAGEGNWTYVMEVLGWNIDTEAGMLALPERKIQKLNQCLAIPAT